MGGVRILDWFLPAAADDVDWERVYAEGLPRVFNYFRYRGFERASAEDLTSVTFERAWRARGRYRRERAAVSTWLLAIARNAATDALRRSRPEVPLEDVSLRHEETPETAALRRAERLRLRSLLAGLPERERELIALKYGAGLTNREIARATGLRESNVGTILHRTIGGLRARWDDEGGSR